MPTLQGADRAITKQVLEGAWKPVLPTNAYDINKRGDKAAPDPLLPFLYVDDLWSLDRKTPQKDTIRSGENSTSSSAFDLSLPNLEIEKIKSVAGKVADELTNWIDAVAASAKTLSENSKESFLTADGASWKKDGSQWIHHDKNGIKSEKYGAKVTDVSRDVDDNLIVKFDKGGYVKEKPDGSALEYDSSNHLKSISYKNGSSRKFEWDGEQLVEMISSKGSYTRSRDRDGKLIEEWNHKAEPTGWSGKISVDQKSGDLTVAKTTYRSDSTVETENPDGSRSVLHPNKDVVKIAKDGRVSEISYADGTKRSFSWQENPNAKGADDKVILSSVQVHRDGKVYYHSRTDGDKWTVLTWENNKWSEAKSETISFNFDNKTQAYSFVDSADGITHIIKPGGDVQQITADGASLEYKEGKLVKASKGELVREFDWKGDKLQSVRDGVQSKTWTSSDAEHWKSDKGDAKSGKVIISPNGEIEFKKGNVSTIIKMDGSEATRSINEKDKSQIEVTGNDVAVTAGDGSVRKFKTSDDGKELIQETSIRNGKTESWTRGDKLSNGNYIWSNDQDPSKKEERSSVTQHDGNLTIKYPDGKVYKSTTTGAEKVENEKQGWSMELRDGRPSELKYANGFVRKFSFDGPGNAPKTMEIKSPDGTFAKYDRISPGVYKYTSDGKEKTWKADVSVTRDGVYKYDEKGDKGEKAKSTTRTVDGITIVEDPSDNSRVEKLNDEVRKVTRDNKTVELVRDSKNVPTEVRDYASNSVYKKDQNGLFVASPIDPTKPFEKMDPLPRRGTPYLEESGAVSFVDNDGSQVRQNPGAKGELVSDKDKTIEALYQNDNVSPAEKARLEENLKAYIKRADIDPKQKGIFLEHLEKIANERPDILPGEKNELYSQLNRLLESKSNKVFNDKDRAALTAQLVWHIANPTSNQQGANPNCQVTTIRGKLLYERPAQFARMMTDVITSGEFKCADNSTIKVPQSSMRVAKGSEESKFPPEDGARTWLGKISDLTCANIHWQRQTMTPSGESVVAGHLVYRHDPPEVFKDTGARVFKDPGDGMLYPQNGADGTLIKQPTLYSADIANVYSQICGPSGTVILAVNREGIKSGEGVGLVSGEEQLHNRLQEGGVKIAQIWTGADWVWKEPVRKFGIKTAEDADGEHVVLVTGYDPKTRTVSIDNSWSTKYDRLAGDRRITLRELYKAMAKQ
jgi:hypothetical protein